LQGHGGSRGNVPPCAPPVGAQATPAAATDDDDSAGPDGGWPRGYSTPSGGHVLMYQPQVAGWTDQTHLAAYAAVAFTPNGADKAEMGTIRIEADTVVAIPERLVRFTNFQIAEANFSTLDKDKTREVATEIDEALPDDKRVIGLDRVLAAIDRSQIVPKNVEGVKADPPKIFFSKTPAVLARQSGARSRTTSSSMRSTPTGTCSSTRSRAPLPTTSLVFPWLHPLNIRSLRETRGGSYFLRVDSSWLHAKDLSGPWAPPAALPKSFSKLPDDDNWKDVKAAALDSAKAPTVFVSEKPAEIILLDGEPEYESVPDVTDARSSIARAHVAGHDCGLCRRSEAVLAAARTSRSVSLTAVAQYGLKIEGPRGRAVGSSCGAGRSFEIISCRL
jgi:hypothetical protein